MIAGRALSAVHEAKLFITRARHYAAAASPSSDPPLMWRVAHGLFDPETSMNEKFPNIPDPQEIPPPTRSPVQVSTLSNGIRVASQDLGGHVSAVGLFIGAGSRHETPYNQGVSQLIDHLAYKGTKSKSKFKLTRAMEKTGGTFSSAVSRESISFFAESLRGSLGEVVEIIADSALNSDAAVMDMNKEPIAYDLGRAEIARQTELMKTQLKSLRQDPNTMVTESIHTTAFDGNTLGLPLVPEERKVSQLTPEVVADFMSRFFTPERIILSGTNVQHSDLVALAEQSLGPVKGGSSTSDPEAKYTGGSSKLTGDGGAYVAIGYKGVSWPDKDLVPVCVLANLLGGGGSFSSGGPGKGMYTRLYTEILNRHGWVASAHSFNECYKDAGVFGIQASTLDPGHLNNLVEVVSAQIAKMSNAPSKEELNRAKAMQKTSLLMNLESRLVVCEDIGRQMLSYGQYKEPKELVEAIEKVTAEDLQRVASRMLQSKPTIVMYGDSFDTYSYDMITSSIKSQAKQLT